MWPLARGCKLPIQWVRGIRMKARLVNKLCSAGADFQASADGDKAIFSLEWQNVPATTISHSPLSIACHPAFLREDAPFHAPRSFDPRSHLVLRLLRRSRR